MNTLKHIFVSIGILCASHVGVTNHFRLLGNQIGSVKLAPVAAAAVVGGVTVADDVARWFRVAIEKSQRIYKNEGVQEVIATGRIVHKAKQAYDKNFQSDR
jgi:hypothetical protein